MLEEEDGLEIIEDDTEAGNGKRENLVETVVKIGG